MDDAGESHRNKAGFEEPRPQEPRRIGPSEFNVAGLSESALKSLEEYEARLPPPGGETEPAYQPSYRHRPCLDGDVTAGGGLVTGKDGIRRPHYWGHRERLRTRFLSGGPGSMPDYELLELLLFNAIPKIDVKPLAKRLLAAFGDLPGVIGASESRILQVEGADRWVYLQLRVADAFAQRLGQARVMHRDVLSSWDALITYCRTAMAHREIEQFRVLFLDRRNYLIADEAQGEGTVNHVPVYPREIVKRVLELGASAVILVHNHPSGDPTPSEADRIMTQRIVDACGTIEVIVHDHVIIGKDSETSFRQEGFIG